MCWISHTEAMEVVEALYYRTDRCTRNVSQTFREHYADVSRTFREIHARHYACFANISRAFHGCNTL